MSATTEDFNALAFEKKLTLLKDTQESIQSLSSWCLQKRQFHKKIVSSWLNVLKRAKVEHRLTLFYLANDVIQYSKRKNYEFVESWGTTLQKATPLVRDDKVKHRILRIFRIWEERTVYDEEFLTDLTGLLSAAAGKQTPDIDPNDFQPIQLVNKIRQCSDLETDTDTQLKQIHECPLALKDVDAVCSSLKERRDVDEAKQELEDGVSCLEGYVIALQKELVARAALCELLQRAHHHYNTQRGEVKVVANAYRNFGGRVRGLKRKLDDLCNTLPPAALPENSPIPSPPSPGEAVPSPGPDEDIDLPGQNAEYNLDKTFSTSMIGDEMVAKGFTSFMGHGDFPFFQDEEPPADKGGNKIEVISSRPVTTPREDFNINEFLKSLIPTKPSTPNNVSPTPVPPPPTLPGLDLLAPPPPPPLLKPNFYTNIPSTPEPTPVPAPENYLSDQEQWNNPWENVQPPVESPESPPPRSAESPPPPPPRYIEGPPAPPRPDVDQRNLMALAPPPRLPLLLEGDDVDHRMLPPLPAPVASPPQDRNRSVQKDVDHRNLISLTGMLPPPPAPPISPWTPNSDQMDQDYRSMRADVPVVSPAPTLQRLPAKMPQHPPKNISQHQSNIPVNNVRSTPPKSATQSPASVLPPPNLHNMGHIISPNVPSNMMHHQMNSNLLSIPTPSGTPNHNMPQHPPGVSHLPPNMPQHPPTMPQHLKMPQHLPNMGQHPPNMSQHPPNMSQHPPNMGQHLPNMAQHPPMPPHHPNMTQHHPNMPQHHPNMPQHPPNMPQRPPNMSQHPPNMLQHPPNMPHHQNISHLPPNMPHHGPSMSQHGPNTMQHGRNVSLHAMMGHPSQSVPDNVESIDMEMSDEEMYEHDDEYGRSSKIEMTLARMHGNPSSKMTRHNQQTQQFRKMDHPREQSFNNNKLLVGGNLQSNLTPILPSVLNTPSKKEPVTTSESTKARSNLVRINSVPEEVKDKVDPPENEKDATIILDEENTTSESDKVSNENNTNKASSPPVTDVFGENRSGAMNPVNPDAEPRKDVRLESRVSQNLEVFHNDWEDDNMQEEPQKWRRQMDAMNPSRPSFPPMRPFHMRGFRNQMFNRPPERFFNPDRGRRPWGPRHHRGFW